MLLDERHGARLGAQHLLDLGHRRIGILTMNPSAPPGWAPDAAAAGSGFVARERQTGWIETLAEAGVTPVVMEVHDNAEPYVSRGRAGAARRPRPADRRAVLLRPHGRRGRARRRGAGLRVPEDLSVVGFDDSPLSRRLRPALTTVHQDFDAKGKAAARALTSSIARFRGRRTARGRSSTASSSTWSSATAPHPTPSP